MKKISLDTFTPRDYQMAAIKALEIDKKRRLLLCWPRRSGKDFLAFQLIIRQAFWRVATFFMIYPTYNQGRKILWDGITIAGKKFIDDFLDPALVKRVNGSEMIVELINGSMIQVVGSDNVDRLVGTNPYGIVFSEYALQNPMVYSLLRPPLAAQGGFAIFLSTPRGKNHFYDMYEVAKDNEHWFCQRLTLDDTQHISKADILQDVKDGVMSEDMMMQEYYCSFEMGIAGSYYTKYMDQARLENRIGDVAWQPHLPVNTAWDIGTDDKTCIIFFQMLKNGQVNIIDYYEKNKEGMEHYAKVLKDKLYQYNKHIAPHDIGVYEFGGGMTRIEKARNLGVNFIVCPKISIDDGIEAGRTVLPRCHIDETKCRLLIKALDSYHQEYNEKLQRYELRPLHDWASDAADAFRYMSVALPLVQTGMTQADADRIYIEGISGGRPTLSPVFQSVDGIYQRPF